LVGVLSCGLFKVAVCRQVGNQNSCPELLLHEFSVTVNRRICHGNLL
jgi:hypothetical protein